MSDPTQIQGDEIWHRGYMVGLLAESGVPSSTMDSFRSEFGDFMPRYEGECQDIRNQAYDVVLEKARAEANNGLIRLSQLQKFVDNLTE
jgi:hypothetical protein